jgi:hypothetical protein
MTGRSEGGRISAFPNLPRQVGLCVAVSALYIWAYFLMASVVMPVQQALFPTMVMSFLFLPHGVRVLTAWLYGWRSVLFLLPGAVLCNLHFAGDRAFDADILFGTAASLLASPMAFAEARRIGGTGQLAVGRARMPTLLAVGIMASVFNLLALSVAYGLDPLESAVILIGDTGGLVAALLIVWLGLKLLPDRG